jgi:hypothetical protein
VAAFFCNEFEKNQLLLEKGPLSHAFSLMARLRHIKSIPLNFRQIFFQLGRRDAFFIIFEKK